MQQIVSGRQTLALIRRRELALLLGLFMLVAGADAQSAYPERPVTIIYGGPAGSVGDIATRAVAKSMSEQLGQPFIIDNRPGAAGLIAMQVAARAKPDGYTLVVGSASSTVVAPAIRKFWPVDLQRDFLPISLIANSDLVLVVAKESPINNFAELVAAAKAAPGTVSYGNVAALYELAMEMIGLEAGIKLLGVPYKGTPEASNDLLGGRLAVLPDSLGPATAMLQSGRTRAIAVLGEKRSSLLPNVPTMVELGYKNVVFGGTISMLALSGTAREIVQRLNAAVVRAVASEEVRKVYAGAKLEPISSTTEELAVMQRRDLALFQKIVADAKVEKQ